MNIYVSTINTLFQNLYNNIKADKEAMKGFKANVSLNVRWFDNETEPTYVSLAAYNLAQDGGFKFKKRGKMKDLQKRGVTYEHCQTVKSIVTDLIILFESGNMSEYSVEQLLNEKLQTAYITIEENKRLNDAGYKDNRDDWEQCYNEQSIPLIKYSTIKEVE